MDIHSLSRPYDPDLDDVPVRHFVRGGDVSEQDGESYENVIEDDGALAAREQAISEQQARNQAAAAAKQAAISPLLAELGGDSPQNRAIAEGLQKQGVSSTKDIEVRKVPVGGYWTGTDEASYYVPETTVNVYVNKATGSEINPTRIGIIQNGQAGVEGGDVFFHLNADENGNVKFDPQWSPRSKGLMGSPIGQLIMTAGSIIPNPFQPAFIAANMGYNAAHDNWGKVALAALPIIGEATGLTGALKDAIGLGQSGLDMGEVIPQGGIAEHLPAFAPTDVYNWSEAINTTPYDNWSSGVSAAGSGVDQVGLDWSAGTPTTGLDSTQALPADVAAGNAYTQSLVDPFVDIAPPAQPASSVGDAVEFDTGWQPPAQPASSVGDAVEFDTGWQPPAQPASSVGDAVEFDTEGQAPVDPFVDIAPPAQPASSVGDAVEFDTGGDKSLLSKAGEYLSNINPYLAGGVLAAGAVGAAAGGKKEVAATEPVPDPEEVAAAERLKNLNAMFNKASIFSTKQAAPVGQDSSYNPYVMTLPIDPDTGKPKSPYGQYDVYNVPSELKKGFEESAAKEYNAAVGRIPGSPMPQPQMLSNNSFISQQQNKAFAPGLGLRPLSLNSNGMKIMAAGGLVEDDEDDKEVSGAKQMMKGYEQLTGPRETQVVRSPNAQMVRSRQASQIVDKQGRPAGMSMNTSSMTTAQGPASPEQMATAKAMLADLMRQNLSRRRFAGGGDVGNFKGGAPVKAGAPAKAEKEPEDPGLWNLRDYAAEASTKMFPKQTGADDQRDAARHMLAAGLAARKLGPGVAEFLGKAHERMSNPYSFFSMLGIGEPRYDYPVDVHNNKLGIDLASRAKSQGELEKMVKELAKTSSNEQQPGRPWTVDPAVVEAIKEKQRKLAEGPPESRADGSPEEGEVYTPPTNPFAGKAAKQAEMRAARDERARVAAAREKVANTPVLDEAGGETTDEFIQRTMGFDPSVNEQRGTFLPQRIKRNGKTEWIAPSIVTDAALPYALSSQALTTNRFNPEDVPKAAMNTTLGSLALGKAPAGSLGMAVRPTGSTLLTGPVGLKRKVGNIDKILDDGVTNAFVVAGNDDQQKTLIQDFWNKKARNYFTRQFGTPDDPIATAIAKKRIKGSALEKDFPDYMIDQLGVGKTRVNEQGQTRFFPKYPRAEEDFTKRYDKATGLEGIVLLNNPAASEPNYNFLSQLGRGLRQDAETKEIDKILNQGVRPELINTSVTGSAPSNAQPGTYVGVSKAEELFKAYEEAAAYSRMTPEQRTAWANEQYGNGRNVGGMSLAEVGENIMPQNMRTAIEKGEPIYQAGNMEKPLRELFNPASINQYLTTLPLRELANIRFEDAVRGGLKVRDDVVRLENLAEKIKAGKPVPNSVFSEGVSAPLLQFKEGPLEGFSWKRIEKRQATVPEGAYVGHSVGGYETGGIGYGRDKMEGFNEGRWQIFTLRDARNRPVNTVEVRMDAAGPTVTQIKGNGRATGNTAPEKYDTAVLSFLQNYLKPTKIAEKEDLLTPILQSYKRRLETNVEANEINNLYAELGIEPPPANPVNAWENVGNNPQPAAPNAQEAARARIRARAGRQAPE
jgi:hypothetical protein